MRGGGGEERRGPETAATMENNLNRKMDRGEDERTNQKKLKRGSGIEVEGGGGGVKYCGNKVENKRGKRSVAENSAVM